MAKVTDLTGMVFGRWTVIERAGSYKNNESMWLCECSCDNQTRKTHKRSSLINGKSKSCGCHRKEVMTKHGMRHTRIYNIHNTMLQRCYNSNDKQHYPNYGGRGIKICDEWLGENGFQNFYNWAVENGYQDNLSIERKDVNGNYCPENCMWATIEEQNNNKRNTVYITINGVTKTLRDWEREYGLPRNTIWNRLNNGLKEQDLLKPVTNRIKTQKKSGIKGIFWNEQKQKWQVRPRVDNKTIHIGFFDDLEEAITAIKNHLKSDK